MRHRSGNDLPQAGHSTCRHDGAAVILDFKPKLANRCSQKVKSGAIRASILDFKPKLANRCSQKVKTRAIRASILDFRPRLANRCSQKVKTGAIRASILDFKPRLANRCSHKVKTGAIRASILDFKPRLANRCSQEAKTRQSLQPKGVRHCAAAGECRMGRDFGRRSRPWLREREGPAAQRWEGKHRRCAPVRSPCPQADSAAETAQPPQADSATGTRPSPRRVRKSYWTD